MRRVSDDGREQRGVYEAFRVVLLLHHVCVHIQYSLAGITDMMNEQASSSTQWFSRH